MTTTFTPGPVIAIEERPDFVRNGDRLQWANNVLDWSRWPETESSVRAAELSWEKGTRPITHIRLDITHPESIRRTWNDAHPDEKPFDALSMGLPGQPDDWDGGEVLLRDGRLCLPGDVHRWQHDGIPDDIIAYRRKPAAETETVAPADNAVRIEQRTEDEWRQDWRSRGDSWVLWSENRLISLLHSLDLIAPEPTTTDRFMAAHPDADRRTAELFAAFGEQSS